MVYRLDDQLFSPPHATSRDVHTRRSAPTETSSVRLRRRVRRPHRLDRHGSVRIARARPARRRHHARPREAAQAPAEELDAAGLTPTIGADHFYPSVEQAVAATMAPSRRSEGRAAAVGLARQLPSSPVTGQIVEGKPTIIARVGDEDFELPDDHEITRRATSRGTSTWPRCTGATA